MADVVSINKKIDSNYIAVKQSDSTYDTLYNELYYKSGDKLTLTQSMNLIGLTNGKSTWFNIPVDKKLDNVTVSGYLYGDLKQNGTTSFSYSSFEEMGTLSFAKTGTNQVRVTLYQSDGNGLSSQECFIELRSGTYLTFT